MKKRTDIPYGPRRDAGPMRGREPFDSASHAAFAEAPAASGGLGAHGARPTGFSGAEPLSGQVESYARARYGAAAHGSGKRPSKKKRSLLWSAVSIVAALVLVACLGVLGVIGYGYWHGSKVYDDIAQQAFPEKEADALAAMTIDWDALYAQNPDTVGWVYMPGTSIDYPIVQGENDEEYLQKDFTGDTGGIVHKGAIFLSADNDPSMADQNNVIYGHNMNDDTMFAHILSMADQQAFDAARTFFVFTPTQNYRCSTYALDVVEATQTSLLQFNFADQASLSAYMADRIEQSAVTPPHDVDVNAASKIFTLITCGDDYAQTRAVLFGAVVEQAAPANAPA